MSSVPKVAADAVKVTSGELPVEPVEVHGYDFNQGLDYHKLLLSYRTSGFQATNFGKAVMEINRMVCLIFIYLFKTVFNECYSISNATLP